MEVFSDAKELEHNAMYTSSIFSKESTKALIDAFKKRKRDDPSLDNDKSNRQKKRTEKDAGDKKARNIGALICNTPSPITLPNA